jgi:hypothetical protein
VNHGRSRANLGAHLWRARSGSPAHNLCKLGIGGPGPSRSTPRFRRPEALCQACLLIFMRRSSAVVPVASVRSVRGGGACLSGLALESIFAVNGLLSWFDVHDTVEEAVSRTGTQRSPVLPAIPPGATARPAPARSRTQTVVILPTGEGPPRGGLGLGASWWGSR